ncbi:Eco57I restriction-modification methylase domain-containing protein, partial [Methanocalculus sp. MSAO_Arc2]|uniref:Eco57I restriction-modification methylase domain-containing protein n=1 Tax=Methanocalculus sp. MSAO_Arc2 TaxID=2293855 RepID=UPI0032163623
MKAVDLLSRKYDCVVTNVPYLSRGKHGDLLRSFCEERHPDAKADIATVFLDRCLTFCRTGGTVSAVMPQNWLFLKSYMKLRERLLKKERWELVARLGPGAFETISGEVVKAILLCISHKRAPEGHLLCGLDVSVMRDAAAKAESMLDAEMQCVGQKQQLVNPDIRISFEDVTAEIYLKDISDGIVGIQTGDFPQFGRFFWELIENLDWEFEATTPDMTSPYNGKQFRIFWQNFEGILAKRQKTGESYVRGWKAFNNKGILIGAMRELPITIYNGELFDNNSATIIPHNPAQLPAIWCFCSSPEYNIAVREIDQKLNVTNATLVKVPFDLDHWTK